MIYTVVFLGDGWSFVSESVQVIVIEMLLSLAIFWCDITYWTFFVDLLFYPIQDYFYVALEMILFCFAGGGGGVLGRTTKFLHECTSAIYIAFQLINQRHISPALHFYINWYMSIYLVKWYTISKPVHFYKHVYR